MEEATTVRYNIDDAGWKANDAYSPEHVYVQREMSRQLQGILCIRRRPEPAMLLFRLHPGEPGINFRV